MHVVSRVKTLKKRRFIAPSSRERGGLIRRAIAVDANGGSRPTELKMERGVVVVDFWMDLKNQQLKGREGPISMQFSVIIMTGAGVDIYNMLLYSVYSYGQ